MAPPTETETVSPPFSLRAYVAGAGATAALIAGALIVFLSAAAFVAFNGMPFGSSESSSQPTVAIASGSAPKLAALRAQKAGTVIGPKAAAISPSAAAEIARANGAGNSGSKSDSANTSSSGATDPATTAVTPATPATPATPTSPGTTAPTGTGPAGSIVNGVDNAASNAGIHTGLGDGTGGITGPVDNAVNNVGGVLGNPHLGDQVGGAVNGATNGLLGH